VADNQEERLVASEIAPDDYEEKSNDGEHEDESQDKVRRA